MRQRLTGLAALALIGFGAAAAHAAAPTYLGAWKISSAVVAPWADRSNLASDAADKTRLMGKTVTLGAQAISGPEPLACKGPHYKLSNATPDLLFQGELGELQDANPKVSAQALAAQLGFTGKTVSVLDTGCDIDWHFVDAHTAEMGLNDYVYTLTKR